MDAIFSLYGMISLIFPLYRRPSA